MGVVYLAEDARLGRRVALKFLPPELTQDAAAKERFIKEARTASQLDHPNICTIHDIGETPDGRLYLAMAYYQGETLKQRIDRGPMPIDLVLDVAAQVAQGLVKAHQAGIVHRDIKPANLILTTDGTVKVLDFGLAKLAGQTGITQAGVTLGTVGYMSPEQTQGADTDPRTDLWSLGVVLYEMIAGQPPFRGDTLLAVSTAVCSQAPAPLTSVRTNVPVQIDRLVSRALEKRPEDRFQTTCFGRSIRNRAASGGCSMPRQPCTAPRGRPTAARWPTRRGAASRTSGGYRC